MSSTQKQCILKAIQDFVATLDPESRVADISKSEVANFVNKIDDSKPNTPKAKSSIQDAWLGYAKKYRLEHDKPSPKDVGDAWKIAKPNLTPAEFADFVELGKTKSKPKSKSESKSEPKSKGTDSSKAWVGYRSEWADKNNALPDGHKNKKLRSEITSFASKDWNKGVGFSVEQKAVYHKLAVDNKQAKLKAK
jgi:hypothetical protein